MHRNGVIWYAEDFRTFDHDENCKIQGDFSGESSKLSWNEFCKMTKPSKNSTRTLPNKYLLTKLGWKVYERSQKHPR